MNTSQNFDRFYTLLDDPDIGEIMIDGHQRVVVEKHGVLEQVPTPFTSEDHLKAFIDYLIEPLGLVLDAAHPIVDVRLTDGTRMHIVAPPVAVLGYTVVMRKMILYPLTLDDLLDRYHTLSPAMAEFLQLCVEGRLNILIAGGTGSGKTHLQKVLGEMIPDNERIIVVQREGIINLPDKKFALYLQLPPSNVPNHEEITLHHLVTSAMKMRPDRILVEEVQWGEALEILTAMNNGIDGSMFNLHATSPHDALARLEVMASTASPTLQLAQVREIITTAIDVIIQQERLADGTRKITKITEVLSTQNDFVRLQDIFEFRRTGFENGKLQGYFTATGQIPSFVSKLQDAGLKVDIQKFFVPVQA